MSIIEVKNLKKDYKINKRGKGLIGNIANIFKPSFKIKHAVKGISFSINKGEMVGFIGPNGAGKSTVIKMLTGILYPTDGDIKINNFVPYKERIEYVKNIGVVFGQKSQLSWDLPVIDSFELLKSIYKIPDEVYENNLKTFSKLLSLDQFIEQPVRQLSLGQRMRADIAAAFLHNPEIVFLDEPTIGLDVVAKDNIRNFIKEINKKNGITMIFTTHDMQDIEKVCERMIIIHEGCKEYDGSVKDIKRVYGKRRELLVEFNEVYKEVSIDIDNVIVEKDSDKSVRIIFNTDDAATKDVISSVASKYEVKDLTIKDTDIESIIKGIYEGSITI